MVEHRASKGSEGPRPPQRPQRIGDIPRVALDASEEPSHLLERIARRTPDCLWYARRLASGAYVTEYTSPSCEPLWAITPQGAEPDGRPGTIVEEDRLQAEALLEDACRSGRPARIGYRVRRPDGGLQWVEDHIVPEPAEPDGSHLLIGVSRDMTERQREESLAAERQREQSLRLLAGGVAHDFNNILMAILGQTSVVRKVLDPEARGQAELRVVEQAAKRAAELCRQLLAYSGRARFELAPADLRELVSDMRGLMKAIVPKNVDLDLELEEGLPLVDLDPKQMRQVIMNVVANAGEAMNEGGGTVVVRLTSTRLDGPRRTPAVAHDPLPAGDYVTLRIEDEGCGMSEDVLERIFDPFFTTKSGSQGLGLAALLGVVRAHSGSVGVESAVGRGTAVSIHLPASRSARQEEKAPSRPEPFGAVTAPIRVLVVEDEPTVRNIVQRMLELSGHRVVLAGDGLEGLERFREAPDEFDLAVLDLTMPRMNGIETMRALREIRPELPILITSGHAEEDSVQRAIRESELAAFIQKPYRYGDLLGKIRHLLKQAGKLEEH